jgi:hypothetical protein
MRAMLGSLRALLCAAAPGGLLALGSPSGKAPTELRRDFEDGDSIRRPTSQDGDGIRRP